VNKGTVPELDGAFSFDSLVIINDAGKELEFDVYLAEEPEQHRRGLMFVRQMPASTGMLFVYPDDGYHLDMLFARADGTVSSIIRDTVPQTLESKESVEPVRYVLELNGGTTRRLGIGESSRIIWSAAE
jgi:uncharacterized membrane protein (UPF0127 family)